MVGGCDVLREGGVAHFDWPRQELLRSLLDARQTPSQGNAAGHSEKYPTALRRLAAFALDGRQR